MLAAIAVAIGHQATPASADGSSASRATRGAAVDEQLRRRRERRRPGAGARPGRRPADRRPRRSRRPGCAGWWCRCHRRAARARKPRCARPAGLPGRVGDRVHRDEVDVRELAAAAARPAACGVGGRVVDAVDHHVLVGHAAAGRAPRTRRGAHDLVDRLAPVERHEHVAQRRPRGVQRDRQRVLRAGAISRSMPGTTPLVLIVMWRAPRPKRARSVSAAAAAITASVLSSGSPMPMNTTLVSRWPTRARRAPEADLVDDLGRSRGRARSQLAGRAERAADRAAGLARDATVARSRPAPRRVAHEHRFDEPSVVEAMQRLLGQPVIGRRISVSARVLVGRPSEASSSEGLWQRVHFCR